MAGDRCLRTAHRFRRTLRQGCEGSGDRPRPVARCDLGTPTHRLIARHPGAAGQGDRSPQHRGRGGSLRHGQPRTRARTLLRNRRHQHRRTVADAGSSERPESHSTLDTDLGVICVGAPWPRPLLNRPASSPVLLSPRQQDSERRVTSRGPRPRSPVSSPRWPSPMYMYMFTPQLRALRKQAVLGR